MSNKNNVTVSFPFFSILCLIFITLKLTEYVAWSWWWVMAPLWMPVAAFVTIVLGMVVLAAWLDKR